MKTINVLHLKRWIFCAIIMHATLSHSCLHSLQALMMLTEMLRDQRGAKLRSFVLPAIGEMLCLIASQVCILSVLCNVWC